MIYLKLVLGQWLAWLRNNFNDIKDQNLLNRNNNLFNSIVLCFIHKANSKQTNITELSMHRVK